MARLFHGKSPTLLAVGEGDVEEAFLKHLRVLYCASGPENPGVRLCAMLMVAAPKAS